MNPTRQQAAKLSRFMAEWLKPLIPNLQQLRVDNRSGRVEAKDHLGWRDVGTVHDFLPIARALGRV